MMHYYKTYRAKNKKLLLAALMLCFGTVATAQVQVKGSVFGGGNLANVGGNSSVKVSQEGAKISKDVYGGGALADVVGTATVQIDSGTVDSNVYGGGLGRKASSGVSAIAATVGGVVRVNIGHQAENGDYAGAATIGGEVFGCNNLNGSPKNNVFVDIWKTAHPTPASEVGTFSTLTDFQSGVSHDKSAFALQAVYGGGNEAHYVPAIDRDQDDTVRTIQVYVHGCDNTVKMVYGGGRAADAGYWDDPATNAANDTIKVDVSVTVDGGRIDTLFAGGDGHTKDDQGNYRAADIFGNASAAIHGGYFTAAFAGSNTAGDIKGGKKSLTLDKSGPCASEKEFVISLFGGANEAVTSGDVELTVGCGVGEIYELYGGSNKAEIINGNVTLNILGGTFDEVFGGSKGVLDDPATPEDESVAANIDGNVTLNLYGGNIGKAFGGSNFNGNITGGITLNVLDHEGTCALVVDTIYGAGNLTAYKPMDTTLISPVVNLIHIKNDIGGCVYGGAKGATATVTANPKVNFGYDANAVVRGATKMSSLLPQNFSTSGLTNYPNAQVTGNVFGGGDAAPVVGNTLVLVQNANSRVAKVFGGGNNIAGDKGVTGTATVNMSAGTVTDGLYGGCNENGVVDSNIFVNIIGGTVGTKADTTANVVYGGGYGHATKTKGNVEVTIGTASAGPAIYGNVYGGSALGSVNGTAANADKHTYVTVKKDTIHGNVFGGGLGKTDAPDSGCVYGPVAVNLEGGVVMGSVFGCNNTYGSPQKTVAVNINNGVVKRNVFGGGNLAPADISPVVTISNGEVDTVFGGGNKAGVGNSGSITLVTVKDGKVNAGVYGGCNTSGTVTGDIAVNISGSAIIGVNDNNSDDGIFGGGYGSGTATTGKVRVNIGGGTVFGDVYGGSAKGHVNDGDDDSTLVTLTSGTINGNLYGGGLGDGSNAAAVNGHVLVTVNGGEVKSYTSGGKTYGGNVFGCNNVNGAPTRSVRVDIKGTSSDGIAAVYGGGNMAAASITPQVNILGGTVDKVYGGGNNITTDDQGVGGTDVTIKGDNTRVISAIYGGCNAKGTVTGDVLVKVLGGTVGKSENEALAHVANIHGGGYGQNTATTGDVTLVIGDSSANRKAYPKIYADVYGGSALGSVNNEASDKTTVNILNGTFEKKSQTTKVGNTNRDTTIYYSGRIHGGGLGQKNGVNGATSDIPAIVNGEVHVNIGLVINNDTIGNAKLEGCSVFGGNNLNGSPQQHIYVDIYQVLRTEGKTTKRDNGYSISEVFGGGNRADYKLGSNNPSWSKKAHTHIHGCDNTVDRVYGGGNRAWVDGVQMEIDGGHFNWVFGGGNGMVDSANVGYGGINFALHGGHFGFYHVGSNLKGKNYGSANDQESYQQYSKCDKLTVDNFYFGANEADINDDVIHTISCAEGGDTMEFVNLYAGSRLARIHGNVVLIIEAGKFENVYGGSEGNEEHPADIDGSITLILRGGQIGNVYGGCNKVGNVTGNITVIVDSTYSTCRQLDIGTIYGASNLAKYEPTNPNTYNPKVNIYRGHVNHDVFGGGRGDTLDIDAGLVTSNPLIVMGGAQKINTSTLAIETVPAFGTDKVWVKGNIYGGGEMASVGKFTRDAKGFPTACLANTGCPSVRIFGGKVGPKELTMPKDSGMVFGGSKGLVGDINTDKYKNLPYIAFANATHVIIGQEDHSSGPLIKGSVYGGAENGHVLGSTYVKIQGGQIGAGKGRDDAYTTSEWSSNSLAECDHWPYKAPYAPYDKFATAEGKYGNGASSNGGMPTGSDGHTFYGNVFGGGSGYYPYAAGEWLGSAGVVYGNTRVEVTGGHILTNIYGGNELTDVEGTATVLFSGGTLGVPRPDDDSINNHPVTCYLFGGGKGDQRSNFSGSTNVDSVYVAVSGGRIYGSIFGGAEDGHVTGNVKVAVKPGANIGMRGTSYVDGNVFGGGRGFSGEDVRDGLVQGNIDVEITGGTMLGSIYGGGRLASVGLNTASTPTMQAGKGRITVNIIGGTIGNDVPNATYGGNVFAGSMGRLTKLDGDKNPKWPGLAQARRTEVTIGDSATIKKNVYGGGEVGFVKDSAIVNIVGGTVNGFVYGGGYGSNDAEEHQNDSVNAERAQSQVTAAILAGRVYGHTVVNVIGGTVNHDVYGGGEMASVGHSKNTKTGNTTVNIGRNDNGNYEGNATIRGNVYGANNIAGTPFGNTRVNIYGTARTPAQEAGYSGANPGYAIANVFGGGHQADYAPKDTAKRAYVHVYGCENTIKNLFGGGDAAAVYGAKDTIDGGRFHFVFGGGNGEVAAADIGAKGTGLVVQAGIIDSLFGGSNKQGSINGPVNTVLNHKSGCTEQIGVFFAGSNEANIDGNLTTNIVCGVDTIGEIYGGCHLADISGNVALYINGGKFHYVFGGSKGKAGHTAADSANIGGYVHLNIHGGQIDTAFGGSNVNGNIGNEIVVNVEDTSSCHLKLKGVYGGGKDAAHTPTNAQLASPRVNIKNGTVNGDVNGGGLGTTAVVTANPKVYIGDDNTGHTAIVTGNVFGGGEAAKVVGTTYVEMKNSHSQVDTIFGGGDEADVSGLATVRILGGTVRHDVYGGGALSKTGGTYVVLNGGTITHDLYGGGHGKKAVGNVASTAVGADVEGIVTIYDSLGTVRNVYGCNNQHGSPTGTVNVNIYDTVSGNVYGGGNEADAKILESGTATKSIVTLTGNNAYAQNVFGGGHAASTGFSTVNITGGNVASGVYGGCESSGDVKFDAVVNLTGGHVGTSTNRADGVFGGGYGSGTGVVGDVTVTLDGSTTVYGDLYGGSALGKVNTFEVQNHNKKKTVVNVLSGIILGNVYGGGLGRLAGSGYEAAAADVNGKVYVNIGDTNNDYYPTISPYKANGDTMISRYTTGTINGGSVYGCNNINGSPKDSVFVNIYGTILVENLGGASVSDTASTPAEYQKENFLLDQVFGGGNRASYSPQSNQMITTKIYGCYNTIRRVFGGSNAAHATRIALDINGGRFGDVFAGGNGEVDSANVTDYLFLGNHGGRFGSLTAGGNDKSRVPSGSNYETDNTAGPCSTSTIFDMFCGNNQGESWVSVNRIIWCGENVNVRNLYGGSNKGHQHGNIDVVINGGKIDNVYGGCKGESGKAANVYGYVNLTIKGGTIKNVYGGCNINGTVRDGITVNVLEENDTCSLDLTNVYGGGNNASYTPDDPTILSPKVNIYHLKSGNSVKGNVYGGGYGKSAYVVANPVVSIGDSTNTSRKVKVDGCIYGGGEAAEVRGNTIVNIKNDSTTVDSNVFGGGNLAKVTGNVDVVIGNSSAGPTINGDIYGGGALSHTGTSGNTDATIYHNNVIFNKGTVKNIYGGGLGSNDSVPYVYGPVNVKVYGGKADTVFGCNNIKGTPKSTVNVDIYGSDTLKAVFGGGNRAAYSYIEAPTVTVHNCSSKIGTVYGGGNAAQVPATHVTVYGGNIATVFGGGNGKVQAAPVAGASTVKIHGGSIGQVFGGNNASGNIDDIISVTIEQKGEGNNSACTTMEVGNVYGGGNLAVYNPSTPAASGKDQFSPKVSIISGNIVGSVYGGGKGIETDLTAGMVKSNTLVDMRGGTVKRSIYGGGELASVGDIDTADNSCKSGTGLTKVLISGGVVGDTNNARMPSTTNPEGDDYGYVFAGGRGEVDSVKYKNANKLALVDSTYLGISGAALITASVYGGCENGMVLRNTHVKISGGQIGTGYDAKNNKWDAAYTKEQWAEAKNADTSGTMGSYNNPFHECDHFPYGVDEEGKRVYKVYDIFAGKEGYTPAEADTIASNGHSFYGNVFGGGSGYYPFWNGEKSVWRRTAGRVNGNTLVEITDSAHILTSVYGGNEYTDVLGHSTVRMSGGTLGVPRSLDSIINHPVTCYLFGAGMGDPRAEFNTWAMVDSVYVEVSGGIIYGSVFGGGEDGHVKGNVHVVVKDSAFIGTWGTSYVDGNVFGGGRGFKGDVLTSGVVAGNVTVDIQGGTMLGSIYGGGRLASVGTNLVDVGVSGYGAMQENENHGYITVNVSGGTIGNDYEYPSTTIDSTWRANNYLPLTEFDGNNRLYHTKGGNVYGGCMGRLTLLDGSVNPKWTQLAKAKETRVNVWGNAVIKGSVYGGGEMGTVTQNTVVIDSGGTIGSVIDAGKLTYHYGSIFGGGYGSDKLNVTSAVDTAGLVMGTTTVYLMGSGEVRRNVFGGGDLATVTGGTTVTVTGGTVGPIDSVYFSGNVYGAGKGKASNDYKKYSNVASTQVTIKGGFIKGDVYGGGADAHVIGNTDVLIDSAANIGTDGLTNYDGNVFGGGRGSGHYKIANDRSSFIIDTTCGRVGGNTNVTMNSGAIKGSIFGGGRMALVGIDTNGTPNFWNGSVYDSANHGMATITVSGGRIGNPDGDALLESDFSIGDIFGSGKGDGVDSTDVLAGRVMNTQIILDGNARIYGSVFGGGEMAGIGWWGTDGTFISRTGSSTVTVNSCDSIGTKREFDSTYIADPDNWTDVNAGRLVHSCTGNVFGASQGDANEGFPHWVSMARSKTATVNINGGNILGEVFGGAEHGTVKGDTRVNIKGGTIIGTQIGTGSTAYYFGSVYGGGYGSDDHTAHTNDSSNVLAVRIAGYVYGNTNVSMTDGTVKANVYGGGSYASVGTLSFDTNAMASKCAAGTGIAKVSISGGTIEGSVFGSSRGDVVELDQKLDDQAWTDSTSVTINTGAQVKGNVFGGGENGHVRGNTFVNIKGGTIGIAAADYNTNVSATEFGQCGNVYGAGSGMDKIDGKYNSKGGIVMGNTKVTVEGGYISRNVYGAGAMASVGTASIDKEHRDSTKTFAFSWPYKYTHVDGTGDAVVTITGGHIGTAANPTLSGDVYGSARGEAGDRYVFNRLANVRTATVTVNYDSPSDNITGDNVIVGSVYGSGENGHVYDSTIVTLENGLVGGSVFGGGKGTDTYLTRLKNPENEQWYDTYERSITAGKVYGNTHVTINGGTVKHSVYGGGNLASVGKGNYDGYGEKHANTDDSLLVENSGHCYVNVYGGTIGVDDENNNGHVFGSSKGIPFKTINKNPRINYSRDFFLAYSNKTTVTIGKDTNTSSNNPRVYGSVFGGGENGHVRLDTWVRINSGEVGIDLDTNITKTSTDLNALTNSSKWIYRGNVFGAGRGMDTTADGQYCSSAGSVTRDTRVDINGGKIYRNVHGGGSLASVGPPPSYTHEVSTCTVNINAAVGASTAPILGTNAYAHYGGYVGGASRGLPGTQFAGFATCKNTVVNINKGAYVRNTVYGGAENGQVLGNTQVNINDGYVRASVYGGGKGSWQDTTLDVNCRHCYDDDTISGRTKGNTEVNLLGGSVQWVYGGSMRAIIDGDATVNVGDSTLSCSGVTFHGSSHGGVYGSNQYVGSPKGDIHVNIYKTAHTAKDSATYTGDDRSYAIGKVIGGGYNANYEPEADKQIYVNVYTCDNTIQDVFGGGDAASVTNTTTTIRGGRFDRVFGGGNGTSRAADVTGTAKLTVTAGRIRQLFGGSNSRGTVKNSVVTISHDSTSCPELIDEYFGGGNEADIDADSLVTTIECGAKFRSVYGGSNKADIKGDVVLNIKGGHIDNVFGGSKGHEGTTSADSANIDGNVTLNIYGGDIEKAFGGSNINGNITGQITVNVDWTSNSTCPDTLRLDTVFGASNLAAYSPSSSLASPEVNLIHATVKDVFGAGKGATAKASANANPKVTIGGDLSNTNKKAVVTGSIFGGGDLADVGGTTTVTVQKSNSEAKYVYGGGNADTVGGSQVFVKGGKVDYLFGGGKGDNTSGAKAKVKGGDTIAITGGRILKAFAGSNLNGDITGRMHLHVNKEGLESLYIGEVYGGGNYAAGRAGTITIGCTGNWTTGEGNTHEHHNDSTNRIGYELEGISVVYGGANRAEVTSDSIKLTISSGIVDSVFGGNNQSGAIGGKIQVNIDKTGSCSWYVGHVFGGGNHAGYTDTTEVNIKAGTVDHHVFGGGNMAGVKGSKVNMSGGTLNEDLYGGCNVSGTVGTATAVTLTDGTVKGSVYGGGLGKNTVVTGKATIDISGANTRVDNDVYGGGNEGKVNGGTDVKIH